MSNKIVKFYTSTNPDHVLEQATGDYNNLVIIGLNKAGQLDVRANDSLTKAQILWLIEEFKHNLLNGDYK